MKIKNLPLILMVAVVAAAFSFAIANALFKTSKIKTKVEVVEPISSDFQTPDSTYFNSNSINPTQVITIGDQNNPNPFNH